MNNYEQIQLMENRVETILKHRLEELGYTYKKIGHNAFLTDCPNDIRLNEHKIATKQTMDEYSREEE